MSAVVDTSARPAPQSNDDVLLRVDDVVKYFPIKQGVVLQREVARVHAVDHVDLEVRRGETLGLVGETGCGKSTLARLITGLHPVTSGHISFEGQDITNLPRAKMRPFRREMQMIFQDPYGSLNPRRRVGSIIGDPFSIHGVSKGPERKRKVQELMEVVGLNPEHFNRFPAEFSGGQRQRIGVARALALRPKLIVCDEPVSALDVSIQAQVINLLDDLQKEFNLTYVFIAHDLSVVRHVSDRVAVMYLGKIVEIAEVDDFYGSARHPYANALLSAVPVADPDTADTRERIVLFGDVPSPVNPPSGCNFHPRCPKAQPRCVEDEPSLGVKFDDPPSHAAACHFPVADGEDLSSARPGIDQGTSRPEVVPGDKPDLGPGDPPAAEAVGSVRMDAAQADPNRPDADAGGPPT
jgi:oligopeptide/dipeptide ABC transporter ATP-binding protein